VRGVEIQSLSSVPILTLDISKMSEIALFKWFGNSRNERHSNYKILECEDGRRLDIHAGEISCSEDELRRGQFITFEIEEKEAKNLCLLREVGVIDWYDYDKGFGCATLIRQDADPTRVVGYAFQKGRSFCPP
jgi:cold shock CspA family protein